MNSLINLTAFRSALTISAPMHMRTMATKAAAASTATKAKTTKKTDTKETKAAKATKTTKAKIPKTNAEKPVKITPVVLPKRPSTAWNMFFMEHLDKIKASGRTVVPIQETPKAAAAWKALSESEKKVYTDTYQRNMDAYHKQIESRLQELTPAEYKLENSRRQALRAAGKKGLPALKDPNAPKRPLSSFFRFSQDQRAAGKHADLDISERAKAYAAEWESASQSTKDRYNEEARKAQAEYKVEKAAYEAGN
ncbi:exp1-like protein [Podila minutissima]|uniref:Exp1-like protein n=1 Tax=Podila minutissima TaxID=64525 RepID=A0A9P5VMU5_9FUNG|nr:exp1-like protein [Podila minutissima]